MSKWVTILNVNLPQQIWIIRTRLESEGIKCFTQDELTIQSDNLLSAALGGVKLMVQEPDVERALEILKEGGYLNEEPISPDLLTKLDKTTSFFPVINRLKVTYRIVSITLILVAIITTIAYFIFKPSVTESLTNNAWCVEMIDFNGKTVGPKTIRQIYLRLTDRYGNEDCKDRMIFDNNHRLTLPGINCADIVGYWRLNDDDDTVVISSDTLKQVFEGVYRLDLSGNSLTLKSKTTTIYAMRDAFQFANPLAIF